MASQKDAAENEEKKKAADATANQSSAISIHDDPNEDP